MSKAPLLSKPGKLPVVFAGHGSPLNAIEQNDFAEALQALGRSLPRPRAILVVSSHWETAGAPHFTAGARPETIHDFSGFPRELFEIRYPAPGSAELGARLTSLVGAEADTEWGYDHGTWSVLRHLYPVADIPTVQLSLRAELTPREHLQLAKRLVPLRSEGILIVASGNIVHNLGRLRSKGSPAYDWAIDFDEAVKSRLDQASFEDLASESFLRSPIAQAAAPTPEHYVPLLYAAGAALPTDRVRYFFEGFEHSALSMRSFVLE